ncbi:MAG: hypothetical protein HQL52_09325 [Magnetococcales bacterium]|nr:hypothetical protein [Magnetococcales bacterium]
MNKKRHNRSKPTPEEIAALGEICLVEGRCQEAIAAFKKLIKDDPQGKWNKPLIAACRGRAMELSLLGQFNKAVEVLEKGAEMTGTTLDPEEYLPLIAQGGDQEKLLDILLAPKSTLAKKHPKLWNTLWEWIAAQLVSGNTPLKKKLPADHPVQIEWSEAKKALAAFSRGADREMNKRLGHIPPDSPFAALVYLLRGLAQLEEDIDAGLILLSQIPDDSPFSGLALAGEVAGLDRYALAHTLPRLGPAGQLFTTALKGIESSGLRLINQMTAIANNPAKLHSFLLTHEELFEPEALRTLCQNLLSAAPKSIRRHEKQFGPIDPLERFYILARHAENEGDLERAQRYWNKGLHALKEEPLADQPPKDQGERNLEMALILRRLDQLEQAIEPEATRTSFPLLEESLTLDPGEKNSWRLLLYRYRHNNDEKAYHHWVTRSIEHFAADPEFLSLGVASAMARKAFKSAAHLATRQLTIDPDNRQVRRGAIAAHLEHARKQIRGGRLTLARKELEHALELEQSSSGQGIVQILQGFIKLLERQKKAGDTDIQIGIKLIGSPMAGHFWVMVEAERLKLPMNHYSRYRKAFFQKGGGKPEREAFLRLTEMLEALPRRGAPMARETINRLDSFFDKGAQLPLTLDETRYICKRFHQAGERELLHHHITAGEAKWPEEVIYPPPQEVILRYPDNPFANPMADPLSTSITGSLYGDSLTKGGHSDSALSPPSTKKRDKDPNQLEMDFGP